MENVSWLVPITARVFVTTRWGIIAACKETEKAGAKEALTELCQAYWQPIYACVRHHGHSPQDAQDLTQDFFLRLLAGTWLKHLDEEKGRFRAYLSVALRNFLRDQWRRRWTLRRGRGIVLVPFDSQEAENGYSSITATQSTPASLYERQWAKTVIEQALQQLRIELRAAGKEVLFDHFDAILGADTRNFPYGETARMLGLSDGALHAALKRWRHRLQVLLREEIGRTVLCTTDIDDELRHLERIFSREL